VQELLINDYDLNTKRMLDLMAVNGSSMPLYLHVVTRVLREMRIAQQHSGGAFNYALFKANIMSEDLTPAQLAPFQQRLDTLESFMPKHQTSYSAMGKKKPRDPTGTDWKSQVRLAIWGFLEFDLVSEKDADTWFGRLDNSQSSTCHVRA